MDAGLCIYFVERPAFSVIERLRFRTHFLASKFTHAWLKIEAESVWNLRQGFGRKRRVGWRLVDRGVAGNAQLGKTVRT